MSAFGYIRPYSCAPAGGPVKVFWCGDSMQVHGAIADPDAPGGTGFDYHGGVRTHVYAALTDAGVQPDFRGSVSNATEVSGAVTGAGDSHSGLNNSHGTVWLSTYFDQLAPALFPTAADYPHIVAFAVGTNDNDDAATATTYCGLMDKAVEYFPRASILFATPANTWTPGDYDAASAQIRIEVATRKARGMNVDIVDVHRHAVLTHDELSDGVHGNDRGYAKLGGVWVPAFLRLVAPSRLAA